MKTMKKTRSGLLVLMLIVAVSAALIAVSPVAASADPEAADLPFTLSAPLFPTLAKPSNDAVTAALTLAYAMDNDINVFFDELDAAEDKEDYLDGCGLGAYESIEMETQIDWALDDPEDAVSGWHHNAYWDDDPLDVMGADENGEHFSVWDVPSVPFIYGTQSINWTGLFGTIPAGNWMPENKTKLSEQMTPGQYVFNGNNEEGGDVVIDYEDHTMFVRARLIVTLTSKSGDRQHLFSPWSAIAKYGKDAEASAPLTASDVAVPVITGLTRATEDFNDNPVVAFTLTTPDSLLRQAAYCVANEAELYLEVQARVKGDEWKNIELEDRAIRAGEWNAQLIYLVEEGQTIAENTEIELRARYYCKQGDDAFTTAYSAPISFGTDEIGIGVTEPAIGEGDMPTGDLDVSAGSNCPICHFCSQPLGLCIFIWIIIIVAVLAVIAVVVVIVLKKKKQTKSDEPKKKEEGENDHA